MIKEKWLCSSFKLCDLVTASEYDLDSAQIVINSDSYPRPAYNPSTIQNNLETYSHLLDAAIKHNVESILQFAHTTAKNITDSAVKIRDTNEPIKVKQDDFDMTVCCKGLKNMEMHDYSNDASFKNKVDYGIVEGCYENAPFISQASSYNCDKNALEMETDKIEEYDDSLSLKSMGNLESIDYPDAPPSTPLSPEMIRSRASFTRKLKGGLAKEFLPSPPPPTPKEHLQSLLENQIMDTSTDFMMRLMRSLLLECCGNRDLEEDIGAEADNGGLQNDIPRLSDYAAHMSSDILIFISTNEIQAKNKSHKKHMWDIADQLACEIVTSSLAELMEGRKKSFLKDETTSCSMNEEGFPSEKKSSLLLSATDSVKVLASELIINAMVHAFAKLRQGAFKHGTRSHFLGQAAEPQPWEERRYSNNFCKDSVNSHTAKSFRCCNEKSELNPITADSMKETSLLHTFGNKFEDFNVLQHHVCHASSLLSNYRQYEQAIFSSKNDIKPWVIKIDDKESRCIQELQCALFWAAASQNGISVLQLDLSEASLQQQLCRLSQSALENGLTVGAFMTSLHEFCETQQTTSRGRCRSSESLLGHLQHLTDNSV